MGLLEGVSPRVLRLAHWALRSPEASKGARDIQGWALEALARRSKVKPVDLRMMSEYQPRATRGDLMREAVSPRAPIDGLRNYTSGSVKKLRISPLGDMTKARNDHKLGVLMDLPASSTNTAILANEAIVVVAQPIEGTSALS